MKRTASRVRMRSGVNFEEIKTLEGKMRYSEEERERLLEGWKMSGQSISAYVREKGLVRWTFTKWIKADREGKPCFVEVSAMAVRAKEYMPEIVIEKGDVKIHIPLNLGRNELRAVMEGLGGAL